MPNVKIQNVVFDLGGVLVDWNPRYLYRKIFGGDEDRVEWFLANVCTMSWNERQDEGRTIAEATQELLSRFPQFKNEIEAYYGRFPEMFGSPIAGSVQLLNELHVQRTPLFALTNWSQEKFPWARQTYPFLEVFRHIVVSGDVGIKKPDPRIFQILISRTGIDPRTTLYIDDRLDNSDSAVELGFHAHHFSDPSLLREELQQLGILGSRK